MAEAFYKKFSQKHEARSAGYSPGDFEGIRLSMTKHIKVCMDEEGIDVRNQISKKINEELIEWADSVILFDNNREDWPDFLKKSNKIIIWEIEDPRHGDLEMNRKVRDQIKEKIKELIRQMDNSEI